MSESGFRCEVVPERERVRVIPVGDVDIATVPLMRQEIEALRDAGFRELILDLRQTTFMDSSGLHLLLSFDEAARTDGIAFSLIAGPPQVERLFQITGLGDRFTFVSADADQSSPPAPASDSEMSNGGARRNGQW